MERWPVKKWIGRHVPLWVTVYIISFSIVLAHPSHGIHSNDGTSSPILRDLKSLNVTCYPKDSCKLDKVSRISDLPDWEKRNCLCDDLCATYGDCCPDSPRFNMDQRKRADQRFSCIHLRQYNFNWIVSVCPSNWTDDETRNLCETEPDEQQIHPDPLSYMPVTSTATGITYRNINCARCQGDTPAPASDGTLRLRFWNPRLECNSIVSGNPFVNKANKRNLQSKVVWNDENKMWGLMIDVDGKGERFHSCLIDPSLPDDLQPYLRPCQPSITQCAPDWSDKQVEEYCKSYTSFVYRSQDAYRNAHCALCNNVQPSDLSCNYSGISFRQIKPLSDFNPSAFALLFDLKDADGSGIVGRVKTCQDGQLFDPFVRKCRQVYCPKAGEVYREGRCLEPTTSSSTTTSTSTTSTTTAASTTPETTTSTAATTTVTDDSIIVFASDLTTTPKSYEITTSATSPSSTQPSTTSPTTSVPPTTSTTEAIASEFASCPKFRLGPDEVEWRENGTLFVVAYNKNYNSTQYQKMEDDGALICAAGLTTVAKFDSILGWVTVAGLGLSELCLALHLIAFVLSPDLRKLSGRNLTSLAFALFAAYGSFIAAQFVATNSSVCLGISISTFYFFLAAFWWTSVLAWDVWRTVRMATVQLRASSGNQWTKFFFYSLYAWTVPALIVAATAVIDFVDSPILSWIPEEYHPHFGRQVCWFGQRKAILVYFAAPLATLLSVNLALFVSSACMIRNTTAKSPKSSNQAGTRKQLSLYVRLALIMGLSWIAGLIAGAADFAPMWYVFVVLCSLQGVFILFAYTCNPKVARSIRNRFLFCSAKSRRTAYHTALANGIKGDHLRRLGLEARDSHDSQTSNASQTSQSSQTSLTKTTTVSAASP